MPKASQISPKSPQDIQESPNLLQKYYDTGEIPIRDVDSDSESDRVLLECYQSATRVLLESY